MHLQEPVHTTKLKNFVVSDNVITLKVTPRILVVDDDRVNRRIWEEVLEANSKLYFAKDGFEALSLYDQVQPTLVVLDRMMPGMHGDEVMAEIRKRDLNGITKIVMHSMLESSDEQLDGMRKGADLYIPKSTDIDVAVTQIQSLLKFQKTNLTTSLFKIAREQNRKQGFAAQFIAENIYRHSKLMYEDIRAQKVDIRRILRKAIEVIGIAFERTEIEFLDTGNDALIMGDEELLKHAFYIVLKRAVGAMNERGQIFVELNHQNEEVLVAIEDNGPQIPITEWRTIFHFECDENKIQVGLPIAWETAQRHLGELSVTEGKQGTRFIFRFPTLTKLAQIGELPKA